MASPLTQKTVEDLLAELTYYRVQRVQRVALEGEPDGISGALLLAGALRESGAKNIIGGLALVMPDARRTRVEPGTKGAIWVPEWDPTRQDVGAWQISRRWNGVALARMPGVMSGTWGPTIAGATAAQPGMCPRFEEQLRFTLELMHDHMAQAYDAGVQDVKTAVHVALAAHNAGITGALAGWRRGEIDWYTTQQDYGQWILDHRTKVNTALHSGRLRNWLVA
jgi:hypothetical protein